LFEATGVFTIVCTALLVLGLKLDGGIVGNFVGVLNTGPEFNEVSMSSIFLASSALKED